MSISVVIRSPASWVALQVCLLPGSAGRVGCPALWSPGLQPVSTFFIQRQVTAFHLVPCLAQVHPLCSFL